MVSLRYAVCQPEQIHQPFPSMHPWDTLDYLSCDVATTEADIDQLETCQNASAITQSALAPFKEAKRILSRAGPPVAGAWGIVKIGIGVGVVSAGHLIVGGVIMGYGLGAIAAAAIWRQRSPSSDSIA
eukprot:Protomagalhaensia_wolfi_Nauph_80__4499@NODE_4613_length_537_cov_18_493976_g3703_i0_p1_GENE_NODE_4613_length_537_cov_18_493976_g3703_i0NODE_4613_length_537_cov_18_493976_g3703_i0_p1_ORF_typecomplete_len128_score19_87_NODE_4613_length_537_cov_18_493976_g3703_i055438